MANHYPASALLLAGSGRPPASGMIGRRKRRLIDTLVAHRHGERGNQLTEWWHFRAACWRARFEALGWQLSHCLGSACWICVMRPAPSR